MKDTDRLDQLGQQRLRQLGVLFATVVLVCFAAVIILLTIKLGQVIL